MPAPVKGSFEPFFAELSYQSLRRTIDDPARNFAQIRTIVPCLRCDGTGKFRGRSGILWPCVECHGTGRIKRAPTDPRTEYKRKKRAEYQAKIESLNGIVDILRKGSARRENLQGEINILKAKIARL